jgi:2'-5' RNA ligase
MKQNKDFRIAYCLLPAANDIELLRAIVNKLAQTQDAPAFEPHLTLYVSSLNPTDDGEKTVKEFACAFTPVHLKVSEVQESDLYTKTLFLKFVPDGEVDRMYSWLKQASSAPSEYTFSPHLSLMYKTLSQAARESLKAEMETSLLDLITFDKISVWKTGAEVTCGDDVLAWREIANCKLSS